MIRSDESNQNKFLVSYERPIGSHRIYASIIDFVITFLIIFLGVYATSSIVKNTSKYQKSQQFLNEIRLDSGLYAYSESNILTIKSNVYTLETEGSSSQVEDIYRNSIEGNPFDNKQPYFLGFCHDQELKNPAELKDFYNNNLADYNKFRLNLIASNVHLFEEKFIESRGTYEIVKTGLVDAETYINMCYKPYLNYCDGNLTYIPGFVDANKILSNMILGYCIPIPIALGFVIGLYIPGLIWSRGRRTIGKICMKCGVIDKNGYSLGFWKFTLRTLIIMIETLLLIPAAASFTAMAFTLKQHNLHDFLLKSNVVDLNDSKIYKNKVEVYLDSQKVDNKVDFNLRKRVG